MPAVIKNVPTNIISGFLGVGKTTAILNLFAQKPDAEKWAVLVNEFGKVGIDGRVYQSHGIAVKEIPGGCMCCAQGLPLQVAVNRLLRETRPDRLLIESSGVGHPAGVLKTLGGEGFQDVLKLKAGICLIDPEHLLLSDYRANPLFKEQLQYADVLVANKTDMASAEAIMAFDALSNSFTPAKAVVASTVNAQLQTAWLDIEHMDRSQAGTPRFYQAGEDTPMQTYTVYFDREKPVDLAALKMVLEKQDFVRAKGLVKTAGGSCLVNYSGGRFNAEKIAASAENYIEVIALSIDAGGLEQALNQSAGLVVRVND